MRSPSRRVRTPARPVTSSEQAGRPARAASDARRPFARRLTGLSPQVFVAACLALLFVLAGCERDVSSETTPPTIVFVVLDNVRADRLSLCGYERPTSPFLERTCERSAATCECRAQAPSSWTVPSHASFFTGADVAVHGAGMGDLGTQESRRGLETSARPLDDRLPTVAEVLSQRGYQTVSVSGNPLISPASGLTRGFGVAHHGRKFGDLSGPRLLPLLERTLAGLDREQPLFLFVNLIEAHRPWTAIPEDRFDWLPARPYLSFSQRPGEANPQRSNYIRGTMPPNRERAMLEHLGDVYDYGVWRADAHLGGVMRRLREGGWLEDGFLLVVTSDHGEHLGDHRLLGHAGPFLYEEITRVPLVVLARDGRGRRKLESPISALAVHDLLLGEPIRRRPVVSQAFESAMWHDWYGIGDRPAVALWRGRTKYLRQSGKMAAFDLARDPGETRPALLAEGPERELLDRMIAALEASAADHPLDPEMTELLRSLGYL